MEATVEIGGVPYTLTSDDDYLARMGAVFEPETVRLLEILARGTALDVGANIGCTALALSRLCGQVHAFEPSPSTYALLACNVAGAPNVRPYNLGLGDRKQRVELTFAPDNRSGGYISDRTKANGYNIHETVEILPLDKLRIPAVDFIKIDVEGFEGHVIRGARRTLNKHRPAVVMELNHWCLNVFRRTSVPDFLDQMRATFPILYAIHEGTYLDLHDVDDAYVVMHRHLVHRWYDTLVGAFAPHQVSTLRDRYAHTTELPPSPH